MVKTIALIATAGLSLALLGCASGGTYETREDVQAGGRRSTVTFREREAQQPEKPYALTGKEKNAAPKNELTTENVRSGPHSSGVTTFRKRD